MRPVRIAFLIAALGAVQAHAGVFDDEEARRQVSDLRIKTEARFDQQAKAQLDLASQIQRQVEEIARLRGQIETLNYELETAKKRQQDFYLDLDTRLRKFESPAAGNAAVDPAAGTNAKPAGDPAKESQDYEAALNQFKAGKYKEAAAGFGAFVQKYPDSSLAPNAQYWLGNAWYAQRDCKRAIEAQSLVTTKYAESAKAPDAWLAISTCQQEMGNPTGAKRSLETVIAKYPSAPAADTARERLKKK
ncbi:tol-pal system protein YbgF [Ferribacterium limneticum]|uniref:tol-pal system protein YbgF n=1 Tax=Ferribacterium limneticum TaxID=76259 RepID=UPI001CF9D4CC|nr:tol-pal system protein YbgF [Ferribacterium limneticum]UCV28373.1 tol-pal system protein YbgF [Ferribacterium limneticum]UCV32290.1 tol-pal system protein YbgF [Ferribacterium limneticum]